MDLNEALQTLQRLGKAGEAQAILDQAVTAGQSRYQPVQASTRISASRKAELLAKEYKQHVAALTKQLEAMATKEANAAFDDTSRVTGITGLTGDQASLSISRRDAGDRVSKVTDSTELQRMLQTATTSGDEVMARAIAARAIELGDHITMSTFADQRPDLAPAVERAWANAQPPSGATKTAMLITGGLVHSLKPDALAGKQDYEIDQLANAE